MKRQIALIAAAVVALSAAPAFAKAGKFDPYTDGARTLAGLDRSGVSAEPARSFDPYTDGARVGKADPYTDGAIA